MKLLEAFEIKNLSREINSSAADIVIEKMVMSKLSDEIILKCSSNETVHPYIVKQLELFISNAYFKNDGKKAIIEIYFSGEDNLSPENLWNKYSEMLYWVVGEQQRFLSYSFNDAIVSFTDSGILLSKYLANKHPLCGVFIVVNEATYGSQPRFDIAYLLSSPPFE